LKDAFDQAVGLSEEEKEKVEKEVNEAMTAFDASVRGGWREGGREGGRGEQQDTS